MHQFHRYRVIFQDVKVRKDTPETATFSLPRQHSINHYRAHIENFGAPNGLCSSITESKHIVAVKRPWHRSSRYEALKQMLTINSRLDKLAAAHRHFAARGMLKGTCLSYALDILAAIPEEDEGDEADDGDTGQDLQEYDGEANDNEIADRRALQMERECGAVDGPALFSDVLLASRKGESSLLSIYSL